MLLLANAGTPLIWADWAHFFIGNPLIGLFEGLLIAGLLDRPRLRLAASMVLGNVFSAIIGRTALLPLARLWMSPSAPWSEVLWGWPLLLMPVLFAFFASIVLEFPFALLGIRSPQPPARRVLRETAIAQCATYPFVVLLFAWVGVTSMVTETTRDPLLSKELPAGASVYFLDDSAEKVRRFIPATGETVDVMAVPDDRKVAESRLVLCREEWNWQFDLWLAGDARRGTASVEPVPVAADLVRPAEPPWPLTEWFDREPVPKPTCLNFATQHAPLRNRMMIWVGPWASEGMLFHLPDDTSLYFALALPFVRWYPRQATVLPGNLVIFEMAGHIWLMHPESGRLTVLTKGRSPVVALR